MTNPYKFRECPTCYGQGYHEHRSCNKPTSECCGGCYREVWCDTCEGIGKVSNEEYSYFPIKERWYRKKFDVKYWRLSCRISLDKYQIKINQNKSLLKELWRILKP